MTENPTVLQAESMDEPSPAWEGQLPVPVLRAPAAAAGGRQTCSLSRWSWLLLAPSSAPCHSARSLCHPAELPAQGGTAGRGSQCQLRGPGCIQGRTAPPPIPFLSASRSSCISSLCRDQSTKSKVNSSGGRHGKLISGGSDSRWQRRCSGR